MFPAAILHYRAFSYRDYDTPTARFPLYYAIRDACGVVDLIQDTLDTVNGSRFNYQTFEPAEGVAALPSKRIQQGLRYIQGGKRKYWITDNRETERLLRLQQREERRQERLKKRELGWAIDGSGSDDSDLEEWLEDDSITAMWEEARSMEFGDYNSPLILDERDKERLRRRLKRLYKKRSPAAMERGGESGQSTSEAATASSPLLRSNSPVVSEDEVTLYTSNFWKL